MPLNFFEGYDHVTSILGICSLSAHIQTLRMSVFGSVRTVKMDLKLFELDQKCKIEELKWINIALALFEMSHFCNLFLEKEHFKYFEHEKMWHFE